MYQFYLLSIVMNLCIPVFLIPGFFKNRLPLFYSFITEVFAKEDQVVLLGFASAAVGVFKLLSPVYGDTLFFGDLFPALCNLGGGGVLILEHFKGHANMEITILRMLDTFLLKRRDIWGYVCLIGGISHFFLPGMLFF